jgi:tellurite resistance protein TerA
MIRLAKNDSARIDLRKQPVLGEITANLNWSQAPKKGFLGGLFGGGATAVDLDLGCLYELQNGEKSAVQALGNSFGSLTRAPYVALDGDDRSGESQSGEWLRINGAEWNQVRRLLIYAFIYEGVANWAETNGRITVQAPGEAPIEIQLDGQGGQGRFCIAALIENDNGAMKVTRVDRYVAGHEEADRAFHWGLSWRAGSKD